MKEILLTKRESRQEVEFEDYTMVFFYAVMTNSTDERIEFAFSRSDGLRNTIIQFELKNESVPGMLIARKVMDDTLDHWPILSADGIDPVCTDMILRPGEMICVPIPLGHWALPKGKMLHQQYEIRAKVRYFCRKTKAWMSVYSPWYSFDDLMRDSQMEPGLRRQE